MIWGYPIFWSTIHLCHTGAYFRFDWDLQIFMESHDPYHSRDTCQVDSLLLSYHDPPVESLLGYPVRPVFLGIWISCIFFFWEMPLWCLDSIQLWIGIIGTTHLMMDDLMLFDFMIYHTLDAILGYISSSFQICRSPLICMIVPSCEIHIG